MFSVTKLADHPVDDEGLKRLAIKQAGWHEKAGMVERWPMRTGDVAKLLVAAEYHIDTLGIADLIERKLIDPPATGEMATFEWSAVDICELVGCLEARHQWQTGRHLDKKSKYQQILDANRELGSTKQLVEADDRHPHFDVTGLIALLIQANNQEHRCQIGALLKAELQVRHSIFIP
jgi:hypothetical protein